MSEPDASSTVKGITKLDLDPVVPTSPIAVGSNNPVFLSIQQTKYLASYASLSAALSAIGSSTKTSLVVTSSTAVTVDTTITNNISVILEGNGVFNISSGKILTIENGAGFQSSPDRQAFSGAGNVFFSVSLPPAVYPEWWGAVGDGSTDDIAAFDKIITAYPIAYVTGKIIKIVLNGGKNYKCSNTWEIDNRVELEGPGTMTFAANKIGIILHHIATKTGSNDSRSATNSIVRSVRINGNNNSLTVVPTHTVSVSGTTVTRTAGASFVEELGYIEGNTIHIDGYNYVIDEFVDGNTLEIKPFPIIFNTTTHTPTLTSVDNVRTWNISGLWDGQDIIIDGNTYSIDTVDYNSGYEVTLTSTFGTTGTYIGYVQGLATETGLDARPNLFHGIDLRSQCRIEDCYIYNFPGNAISAGGSNTQGIGGTTPNENNCFIERNAGYQNSGSGFFSQGLNSNQINVLNNDFTDNRGYGIWEHGFLGNQYFGNHTSFNYSGSTDMVKNGVNGSTFLAEYTEGGQPAETYGQNSIKIGGTPGAGIAADSQGGYLRTGGGINFINNLAASVPIGGINTKSVMSGLAVTNQGNAMLVFGAGEEDANVSTYPATQAKYPAYQLLYGLPADGWYGLQFKTDTLTTPGTTAWASGSEAQEGGGTLWLRNGFGVGERTLSSVPSFRSRWKWVTSIPTSGTTLAGDIFWNSTGTPLGWITTTAGTIGSGAVLTPFGASNVSTILTATASLDFSNIVKFTAGELTVTVSGAAVGDVAHASPSTTLESGLVWSSYVSATDTVTIRVANVTSANIDPASRSWRVAVIKF